MSRDLKPRCGKPMRRYATAVSVPGRTWCGRPEGHNGKCRTVEACARYYANDVIRITEGRRRERAFAAVTAAVKPSACGTYLGYLLHRAHGERCLRCLHAAAVRWAEQVVLDHYREAA